MKQIETSSDVQLEVKANAQRSGISGKPQEPLKQTLVDKPSDSSKSMKSPSPAHWFQKALAFAIATTASATLGLTAAMLLPLPMGLVAKDKNSQSLDLWQVGIGYRVGRPVNVLVMGIDRVPGAQEGTTNVFSGRSDTMLLLRVDPDEDSVSLMSIPRDTQVYLPGTGTTKINDANVQGGAPLAAQSVSSTLNGVPIDRYVRVSTDAFKELVDLLGGVEVYVPKPMVYEDKTQKLKINLSQGLQTLNGEQAEQFARFRQDDLGDIGRVQRQQVLLKVLRKRLTSPAMIPRIPALVKTMQKYIDTNLSVEEMLALVGAGRKLSEGKFKMVMLPGRFSAPDEFAASYWIMDSAGRDRVMKQYFGVDPVDFASETSRPIASLRIAIQNASRNSDGAYQMRQHLAKLGFRDVYITSDWPNRQSQTHVIAQRGDFQAAEDLQKMLRAGTIEADSTGDLESDITIRVGDDWASRK